VTKKLTISVPDDVAERISHEENVSAWFTDAARAAMRAERFDALHRNDPGYNLERARTSIREQLERLDREWTVERRAAVRAANLAGARELAGLDDEPSTQQPGSGA
jgi:hypothetical protein